MEETQPGHSLRGPHFGTFIPLRLLVLPERRELELVEPAAVVGRHTGADVRLAHPDISRRHCRLAFAGGAWRVYDLDSLNGVYVNHERVHEAALYEGDQLTVGGITLLVTGASPVLAGAEADVLRSIAEALPARPS